MFLPAVCKQFENYLVNSCKDFDCVAVSGGAATEARQRKFSISSSGTSVLTVHLQIFESKTTLRMPQSKL